MLCKSDRLQGRINTGKNTVRDITASLELGGLVSKNVKINARRTSIRLEPEMWQALYEIAELEDCSIHDLCTAVNDIRESKTSFTAALRVFLMLYYRSKAIIDTRVEKVRHHISKN